MDKEDFTLLLNNLERLKKWCQSKDPKATIWLHIDEAITAIKGLNSDLSCTAEDRMTDTLTICARAMAEASGLDWDALPDKPDMVCGHSMPEGCRRYWRINARACLTALAENVSGEMVEAGGVITQKRVSSYLAKRDAGVSASMNSSLDYLEREILSAMVRAAVGEE